MAVMVGAEHIAGIDSVARRRSTARWPDGRVAAVIGAAATVFVVAGSWIPSLWGDEAASIMSARRDWASLWAMLGTVDAVHGFYYVLLHLWIDIAGDSPLAIRLPSGLAVGAASAGLFLLVRRRAPRETAVIAAVIFAVLPRVTFLATEARSLAFATAAAVWLTLLALRLLDAPMRRAWWWVYAIGLALASYLFLYTALLIPVHAIVVALELRRAGHARGTRLRAFPLAWASAALLACPIGVIAVMQRDQIAFTRASREVTPEAVLIRQWFMFEPVALVAWAFIAVAVAVVITRTTPHRHGAASGERQLLVLGAVWALVPTAALLLVAAVASLGYTPRYLAFCAPAAAILIAIAVAALPRRWMRVVAIAVIAALAQPAYLDQRSPYWKNGGTDWQAVSEVVAEVAEPGDGVVFDEAVRPSRRPRLAMHAYPQGFEGLVDLALVRPYDATDHLWDVTAPLRELVERLAAVDRVIVVSRGADGAEDDVATLRRAGFEPGVRVELVSTVITVHERTP
jgi:mannosyltransferase